MKYFYEHNGDLFCAEYITDKRTGKRRRLSVKCKGRSKKDKSDAEKRLDVKLEKAGLVTGRVSDMLNAYLAEMSQTKKASTMVNYDLVCRRFIDIVGDMPTADLSAAFIRSKLLASGLSPKTMNYYVGRWKVVFLWGYRNDYLDDYGVIGKLTTFSESSEKVADISDKFLEREELAALLQSELLTEQQKLLVAFLALSGLRIGEALALENVDVGTKYIRVEKTVEITAGKIGTPKTSSSYRKVYIQEELGEVIRKIRAYNDKQCEMLGYDPVPYFWPDINGKRLGYDGFEKALVKASAAIGHRITPHALRHTHTSLMIEAGMSLEEVQRRLGHENSNITKRIYAHVTRRMQEASERKLDKISLLSTPAALGE